MSVYFAKDEVLVSKEINNYLIHERSTSTLVHIINVGNTCSVKSRSVCTNPKFTCE